VIFLAWQRFANEWETDTLKVFKAAIPYRNDLLDQKVCQYLHEDRTLNDLSFEQTKVLFKVTESIRILTAMATTLLVLLITPKL